MDSSALAEALESGRIFAAGVDVVDGEPNVSADHPLVKQPRCIVLPHIGSATWDAREGMAMLCKQAMTHGFDGFLADMRVFAPLLRCTERLGWR